MNIGPANSQLEACDLTSLDYFLWGYVNSKVHTHKPIATDAFGGTIESVIRDI